MNGNWTASGGAGNCGGLGSAPINSMPTPPAMGVHDYIAEQRSALAELHQLIGQLEDCLTTVLRQMPTSALADKSGTTPESTQVVQRVQDSTRSVRLANERLSSIFQRIEL